MAFQVGQFPFHLHSAFPQAAVPGVPHPFVGKVHNRGSAALPTVIWKSVWVGLGHDSLTNGKAQDVLCQLSVQQLSQGVYLGAAYHECRLHAGCRCNVWQESCLSRATLRQREEYGGLGVVLRRVGRQGSAGVAKGRQGSPGVAKGRQFSIVIVPRF